MKNSNAIFVIIITIFLSTTLLFGEKHYTETKEFEVYYEKLEKMDFVQLIKETTKHGLGIPFCAIGGTLVTGTGYLLGVLAPAIAGAVNGAKSVYSGINSESEFKRWNGLGDIEEFPGKIVRFYITDNNSLTKSSYWKRQAALEVLDKKYGIVTPGKDEKYKMDRPEDTSD